LRRGEGISGYVLNCGMTVMANNAQRHPHYSNTIDREMGFNTKSVLSVPLISQGIVIGVIELLNKKEGPFIADDKQLLQSIAASVSIALENAKLYNETVAMADKERGIRKLFQKFVPREVVDKIILGVDKERPILEEFKLLTLLNIDIRDFSPLSKKIGPKKTVDMLNYFFSIMGEIVFKHQGIVDKYLGDGFLAVFGAPVSSATDAENAVMAALEMQKTMKNVNNYCQKKFGEKLFMGLVIHTGEVIAGNIGFEKKMDYTVIGNAVNFVFKLQTLCKEYPNEILISETTLQATESIIKEAGVGVCEIESTFEKNKIYRIQKTENKK
jgi:class 3 adenylate cyclase